MGLVAHSPGSAAAPTLVVTRPEPQCSTWVTRLQALGQPAQALPLLRIDEVPEFAAAIDAVWAELLAAPNLPWSDAPGLHARAGATPVLLRLVMFVSPNAVERFFARRPEAGTWPLGVLAGATGPGTVAALRSRAVPEGVIAAPRPDAAQFDADTLWQHVLVQRDWVHTRVLVVRGEAGRDWLATTLRTHGAQVQMLAAYRQAAPVWDPAAAQLLGEMQANPQRYRWLFSSSQAVRHLLDHLRAQIDGHATAALLAVPAFATHPRIAESAVAAGFASVVQVRPEMEQIVTAMQNPLDTMPDAGCQSCPPSL